MTQLAMALTFLHCYRAKIFENSEAILDLLIWATNVVEYFSRQLNRKCLMMVFAIAWMNVFINQNFSNTKTINSRRNCQRFQMDNHY